MPEKFQRLAPGLNAYTLAFDPVLLAEIQAVFKGSLENYFNLPAQVRLFKGGKLVRKTFTVAAQRWDLFSYDRDPLFWLSSHDEQGFQPFQTLFEALDLETDLKARLEIAHQPRLYCGFWVLGNQAPAPVWHYDYHAGAQAFTLITPLFEWNPDHGHLLYERNADETAMFHYRLGEALVFGAGFLHSTAPYVPTSQLRVLLSLTFGSDHWKAWPIIKKSVLAQSRYYHLPCGHGPGFCFCRWRDKF